MTGLDPDIDKILEIAVIITDTDLNIIEEFRPITIGYDLADLEFHFGDKKQDLLESFEKSGMLKRVESSNIDIKKAEAVLLQHIKKHCERKECHLAGSSINRDAQFVEKCLPKVWDYLHYKLLNVTSIKLLRKEWYPEIEEFEKSDSHDALTDIRESIEQLKYYRQNLFVG